MRRARRAGSARCAMTIRVPGPPGEGVLGLGFGGGIEVAGGLVEDGDLGWGEVGTGKRDKLPLAIGQCGGIQRGAITTDACHQCGCPDGRDGMVQVRDSGTGTEVGQVFPERAGEFGHKRLGRIT